MPDKYTLDGDKTSGEQDYSPPKKKKEKKDKK